MGFLEWAREFAGRVTTTIETGLRGVIGIPEEIEPYLPSIPATEEEIAEAMEEAIYAERFIQDIELDQAYRLARGVRFYEPLTNVARMRHWTVADPTEIKPDMNSMISQRRVLIGPDGVMTHVDISFGYGELYSEDEALRKAASALDNEFVERYEGVGRSSMVQRWTVASETYIQRYKPLR